MLCKMSATASLVLLSFVLVVPAGATIITIDDFTSDTLIAAWVHSTMLNTAPSTSGSYVFDTTTNQDKLTVSHTGWTSGHKQDAFLRGDSSLGIGETLLTDLIGTPSYPYAVGLMIAAQTGVTERKNIMYISYNRGSNKPEAWYFYGDGTFTSVASSTAVTGVSGFYITRTAQHDYALGYFLDTAPTTKVELKTFTTTGTDLGAAVGYYVYSAANGGTAVFDNLRKEVVPEPSTLALLAGGLVGLLAYAWRKRR